MPRRAMRRFEELPTTPRVLLAGLIVLVLLVLLSPLVLFMALLLFGVSAIALIVQACQRRSLGRWPVVAVASLVLALVFGGISNALYGIGPLGDIGAKGSGVKAGDERGAASAYGEVAPELREVAERWHSSSQELPLLLPSRLPFRFTEVEPDNEGLVVGSGTGYQIKAPGSKCAPNADLYCANGLSLVVGERGRTSPPPGLSTVEIDGRTYYYDDSEIKGSAKMTGQYPLVLWVQSQEAEGGFFPYEVSLTYRTETLEVIPLEEFMNMVKSMKRIDPSAPGSR